MFIDIFVLIVVFVSILIAFLRGFIREVLTIFGIGGGIVAAYIGGPILSPLMYGWMGITEVEGEDPEKLFDVLPYPLLADLLSYSAILIVFVLVFSVISHFLAEFAKNIGLGVLDRTLGVVFGFARGVLVLGLLYLPFFYLIDDEQKENWFKDSKTHIYLETASSMVDSFIPKSVEENIQESADTIIDMSETRKKLEEMDLLKTTPEDSDDSQETQEQKDGYSPEFRQDMDNVFENNIDDSEAVQELP